MTRLIPSPVSMNHLLRCAMFNLTLWGRTGGSRSIYARKIEDHEYGAVRMKQKLPTWQDGESLCSGLF